LGHQENNIDVLHFKKMKINAQLLEKYFKGLCTDEEAEIVAAYLEGESTPEADEYFLQASEDVSGDLIITAPQKEVKSVRRILPVISTAAALLILLSVLAWVWTSQRSHRGMPVALLTDTIVNNTNTIRLVHMSDGSSIWLNANSSIVYNKQYNGSNRDIWLQGEAYFDVSKQVAPFRVHTASLVTTVLGTSFNISTDNKANGAIQISLVTGKVAVSHMLKGNPFRHILKPGEMIEYIEGVEPGKPHAFNNSAVLGWKNYKLVFDKTTLADAFTMLENRYNCKITIKDKKLIKKEISGVFNSTQSIKTILETLGYVHRFSYEYGADTNHYIINRK
jgi:ferric-dicitrate binding protein FerR (iron transport regulator)